MAQVAKNTKTGSPSTDNASSENQHFPSIFQWPFTPQNAVEQSQLTSRPSIATQSSSPIIISRWNFPPQQQNQTNHQVQQGQLPTNYTQATPPLWLPHRPSHPLPGVNSPSTFPPFIPLGMTEISWQAPAVGGGTVSTNQPQAANFCYPVGYTYPGFPGKLATTVICILHTVMHSFVSFHYLWLIDVGNYVIFNA